MSSYNILPMGQLRYEDLRDTLNAHGGDVTNEVSTAFSVDANINKWSRRKPIALARPFITYGDYEMYAKDANYGLVPAHTSYVVEDLPELCREAAAYRLTWGYRLPTGSWQEPFRMGDFLGYDTTATNWLAVQARVYREGQTRVLRVTLASADVQSLADWEMYSQCEGFGFAIWKGTDYRYYHGGTIADWSMFDGVPLDNSFDDGDWHVVLCLDEDSRSARWVTYREEQGKIYPMPVESADDLATFTLSGSVVPPVVPSGGIIVSGYFTHTKANVGGEIEIQTRGIEVGIANDTMNTATFSMRLYTQTAGGGGTIEGTANVSVGAENVLTMNEGDFGRAWSETPIFFLPQGQAEPIVVLEYIYNGETYTYILINNEIQ